MDDDADCFFVASLVYYEKIIGYCDHIAANLQRFGNSYETFCNDVVFQDACCMCVLQIGELAGALSEEFRTANKSILCSFLVLFSYFHFLL